jgi:predicted RNase H-like nuclease (RuvC/YqgF family)
MVSNSHESSTTGKAIFSTKTGKAYTAKEEAWCALFLTKDSTWRAKCLKKLKDKKNRLDADLEEQEKISADLEARIERFKDLNARALSIKKVYDENKDDIATMHDNLKMQNGKALDFANQCMSAAAKIEEACAQDLDTRSNLPAKSEAESQDVEGSHE